MTTKTFHFALVCGLAGLAMVPALAADEGAVLDLDPARKGGGNPLHEVASFSWGTSNPNTRGQAVCTPGAAPPAFNQNASRTNNNGRAAAPAPAGPTCVTVKTTQDVASGQATGRRKGWDGCVKGVKFADVGLSDSSGSYRLSDVTVEACTADGAVLSFRTVSATGPQRPTATMTISGSG